MTTPQNGEDTSSWKFANSTLQADHDPSATKEKTALGVLPNIKCLQEEPVFLPQMSLFLHCNAKRKFPQLGQHSSNLTHQQENNTST